MSATPCAIAVQRYNTEAPESKFLHPPDALFLKRHGDVTVQRDEYLSADLLFRAYMWPISRCAAGGRIRHFGYFMRKSYPNIWKTYRSGCNFAMCSTDWQTFKTFNILIFGTILQQSYLSFELQNRQSPDLTYLLLMVLPFHKVADPHTVHIIYLWN